MRHINSVIAKRKTVLTMANEKRLIDANKTMNSIVDLLELEWGYDGIREDVQQIFENAETVNAVEVVKCKDCIKRYDTDECPMCFVSDGKYYEYTNGNGYCDRGERKEE